MAARIEGDKKIVARMERSTLRRRLDAIELDPRSGYAASAPGYDATVNPLIEAEHPIVESGGRRASGGGRGRRMRYRASREALID